MAPPGFLFSWATGISALIAWSSPCLAAELHDFETDRFSGAANCAFCHERIGGALVDKKGTDVSIPGDWRGTMMAHSFKDPFWRAVMEAEVEENPGHKSFIEDKCLTCHASVARAEANVEQTVKLSMAAAKKSDLAAEGVGCTLCHQIQPGNLGKPESFTGKFIIGQDRLIYGPYDEVVTMPMVRHVGYTPTYGQHIQDSALCGTCHTLFTPILGRDGNVAGQFPEQVPYLEWRNSAYPAENIHCQDCHLPRLDEPIKISARPPWLDPREPFWRHQFAGGNVFMLRMLSANSGGLGANGDPGHFRNLIQASRSQLGRSTSLVAAAERTGDAVTIRTRVTNRTGHKFPTGHPYRRAWIHLQLKDVRGRIVFESGAPGQVGQLGYSDQFSPHYQTITEADQVQVYQAVMGDMEGKPTWSLLRAASLLKDNRLPPRGFEPKGDDRSHTAVIGSAARDGDFHANNDGSDETTYRVQVPGRVGELIAEVKLLYQSVPPEAVARLLESEAPAARTFARLYRRADKTPETVARVQIRVPGA